MRLCKVTRKHLGKLVDTIVRQFEPFRIILFGSYAWGRPTQDSDVDLLVIMNTKETNITTAVKIGQTIEHNFPIDIIVRTPEQVRQRLEWGDTFITQIMSKGRILYEADSQRMGRKSRR